jgi:hypothetical protein
MAAHQFALFASAAPPVATAPRTPMNRHYYRCVDCLTVMAAEVKLPYLQGSWRYHAICDACGGKVEYMGEVHRDRLTVTQHQTPCDDRCTHARGPSCDCKCGGKNHGSHLTVAVRLDAGAIPHLETPDPARARLAAEQYRARAQRVQQAINDRYGRVMDLKRAGVYLDGGDYGHWCRGAEAQRALNAARQLRTHAGRNKRLEQVYAEYFGQVRG